MPTIRIKMNTIYEDYDFLAALRNEDYSFYQEYLSDILLQIIKLPLKKENGKISATKTLEQIKDNRTKAIMHVLGTKSRSLLYKGSAKDNIQHCSLVPLVMSAYKRYNGVQYEEWDKTDSKLSYFMGEKLHNNILSNTKPLNDLDIKTLRQRALTHKGKTISKVAWPRHQIMLADGRKWPGAHLLRHILLQTWMANVQHRSEYMILDPDNWDNMPEAFDEYIQEKPKVDIVARKKEEPKKTVEELLAF